MIVLWRCIITYLSIALFVCNVWAQTPAERIPVNLTIAVSSPALADMNGDGYIDLVFVSFSNNVWQVHALDGAADPPYTRELYQDKGGRWPRTIYGTGLPADPTVAVGHIDPFSNELWVGVGGLMDSDSVFVFRPDGSDAPGFPQPSSAPPYFNAFAIGDVQNQGIRSIVTVDESTILHRFNPIGKLRQKQWVGDPIYSSPALGDVGTCQERILNPSRCVGGIRVADGIADLVSAASALGDSPGKGEQPGGGSSGIIRAFDSIGHSESLQRNPPPDQEFNVGELRYMSSPALVDLDGDGTQDIAIQGAARESNKLQIFLSNGSLLERDMPTAQSVRYPAYSSPAIVYQGVDALEREIFDIYIGSDGGILYAYRYTRGVGLGATPLWSVNTPAYDRSPISSSPVVAKLRGLAKAEVVFATTAGYLYIVDPDDGAILRAYSLHTGFGNPTIISTPAISARNLNGSGSDLKPMIVAGNERGIFKIVLDDFPDFDPTSAVWPTFRGNNERTGALPFPRVYSKGSAGGMVTGCNRVDLLDVNGEPINDGYGLRAVADAVELERSSGRYIFELLSPGDYTLRFNQSPKTDQRITVVEGVMQRLDFGC